jgi:acetyl esterase/lipase
MSTHPDDHHVESTPAAPDVDARIDARPDFAVVVYPAYLVVPPDMKTLDPVYTPNQFTPPTFMIQAEDDRGYGRNAPVYFQALAAAKVPTELHMYATGGHGFGLHPVGKPEEHWTQLATTWLRSINMIPTPNPADGRAWPTSGGLPCAVPQAPLPGNPASAPVQTQPSDPACW